MAGLRVVTRSRDLEEFIATFSRLVDGRHLVLAVPSPLPLGAETAFEVTLADGTAVLRGAGRVAEARAAAPGRRLGGLKLELTELDEASRELHLLLLVARVPVAEPETRDTVPMDSEVVEQALAVARVTKKLEFGALEQVLSRARPAQQRQPVVSPIKSTLPLTPSVLGNVLGATNRALLPAALAEEAVVPAPAPPILPEADVGDLDEAQVDWVDERADVIAPSLQVREVPLEPRLATQPLGREVVRSTDKVLSTAQVPRRRRGPSGWWPLLAFAVAAVALGGIVGYLLMRGW